MKNEFKSYCKEGIYNWKKDISKNKVIKVWDNDNDKRLIINRQSGRTLIQYVASQWNSSPNKLYFIVHKMKII